MSMSCPHGAEAVILRLDTLGMAPGVDPTVLETARQMLIDGTWELGDLTKDDIGEYKIKWRYLSQMLTEDKLLFAQDNGGYRYLTFAGNSRQRCDLPLGGARSVSGR